MGKGQGDPAMSEPTPMHGNCPHCGAYDNTGVTFRCGTQHVGMETFQSDECRQRQEAQNERVNAEIERQRNKRHFEDYP